MDIMKPIATELAPTGDEWCYEVKYDGFRCVLVWTKDSIQLLSKREHDLTNQFPEIIAFCKKHEQTFSAYLPLIFDGELVILNQAYQANFPLIQTRGRMKRQEKIQQEANKRPATLMVFDCLQEKGKDTLQLPYIKRRQRLEDIFSLSPHTYPCLLQLVEVFENVEACQKLVFDYKGEGVIAKRKRSIYKKGKNHRDWLKIKNWRIIQGILTAYDHKNDYFTVSVYDDSHTTLIPIGKCKHGLTKSVHHVLRDFFQENGEKVNSVYTLPPTTCARIRTLDLHQHELREPEFEQLTPEIDAKQCTITKLKEDMAMFPKHVNITSLDKTYWLELHLTKRDYLVYLREISPFMLRFFHKKAVTLIRCPDGVHGEIFFQKHARESTPEHITKHVIDEEVFIICDSLEALLSLGNQAAIEYHLPFQTVTSDTPNEIVFDLDPPSRESFHLAIEAAINIKQLLDSFQLLSFIKTSGNKGLQIHIPLPENSLTYEDTAIFTKAIAWTVEKKHPNLFTTERMKNKRNGRLYLDYVQHGKDKTIIAPYSARKTMDATVATPLFWEEVNEDLHPEQFTIKNVVVRVKRLGCPFASYNQARKKQPWERLLEIVRSD